MRHAYGIPRQMLLEATGIGKFTTCYFHVQSARLPLPTLPICIAAMLLMYLRDYNYRGGIIPHQQVPHVTID